MKVRLQKLGNSNRIRIPNNISKPKKGKIYLEEKFLSYKDDNLAKEFTWDNPKGKELW